MGVPGSPSRQGPLSAHAQTKLGSPSISKDGLRPVAVEAVYTKVKRTPNMFIQCMYGWGRGRLIHHATAYAHDGSHSLSRGGTWQQVTTVFMQSDSWTRQPGSRGGSILQRERFAPPAGLAPAFNPAQYNPCEGSKAVVDPSIQAVQASGVASQEGMVGGLYEIGMPPDPQPEELGLLLRLIDQYPPSLDVPVTPLLHPRQPLIRTHWLARLRTPLQKKKVWGR